MLIVASAGSGNARATFINGFLSRFKFHGNFIFCHLNSNKMIDTKLCTGQNFTVVPWSAQKYCYDLMTSNYCKTKSPFCRWHFPTYFYKWKAFYLMVWRRTGGKTLFEPMLTPLIDAYMRHQGNDRMNRISSIREFCKRRTKFSFDCHHNQWQANLHNMHSLSMVS